MEGNNNERSIGLSPELNGSIDWFDSLDAYSIAENYLRDKSRHILRVVQEIKSRIGDIDDEKLWELLYKLDSRDLFSPIPKGVFEIELAEGVSIKGKNVFIQRRKSDPVIDDFLNYSEVKNLRKVGVNPEKFFREFISLKLQTPVGVFDILEFVKGYRIFAPLEIPSNTELHELYFGGSMYGDNIIYFGYKLNSIGGFHFLLHEICHAHLSKKRTDEHNDGFYDILSDFTYDVDSEKINSTSVNRARILEEERIVSAFVLKYFDKLSKCKVNIDMDTLYLGIYLSLKSYISELGLIPGVNNEDV